MDGKYNVSTLDKWFADNDNSDLRRKLFLNLDNTMKYVHNKGYCVKSFNPSEIEILNNSPDQIKFKTLIEFPNDEKIIDRLINEDIYNSSLLQVGLYSDCLKYMNEKIVVDNFDNFLPFIPDDDERYYKGVLVNKAKVYFVDYEHERLRREKIELQKELNELSGKKNDDLTIDSDLSKIFFNDKMNHIIYKQLDKRDGAFVHVMSYPAIILVSFILMTLILLIFAY